MAPSSAEKLDEENLHEILAHLLLLIGHGDLSKSNQEIEQLADGIIVYGRMQKDHYGRPGIIVDARELERRFRENRRTISRALKLLNAQGRARETNLGNLWKLEI